MLKISIINSIAEKILSNRSIEKTTTSILENLKSELDAFAGVIFLFKPETEEIYAFAHTDDKNIKLANKILARDPSSITFKMSEQRPLMVQAYLQNKIIIDNNLANFFSPVINRATLNMIQRFLGIKACLCSPVRINNKAVGCLFMVFKSDQIDERMFSLVQLYANMSGIALENHRNIERIRQQYEAEKESAALLTHELKTPIAIAYNSSELLSLTIKKYEKLFSSEFIDKLKDQQSEIQESIVRMNRICNSIFSLTEVENNLSIENQKLNLSQTVGGVMKVYQARLKQKLRLAYSEKLKSGVFYGPAVQFEQVICIVLDNAIKYSKQGVISVNLSLDGKNMTCSVSDQGEGIPKAERQRVFERFYRAGKHSSKKESGLGLGLYIAKKIMDKIGGTINILDNPKGVGTKFVITCPVYRKK